jgi:Ser/Thr protein kinase RdoA (MazF antagonist)
VLARLHALPLAPDPEDVLASRTRRMLPLLGALSLAPAELAALQQSITLVARQPQLQFVHGDPGAHNLLWDGRACALLDWEWAGWGNPLVDVAWAGWAIRFRRLGQAVWQAFLEGYGRLPEPQGADLRALALAQIAALLIRTAHAPAAQAAWRQRLAWTLSDEFGALHL